MPEKNDPTIKNSENETTEKQFLRILEEFNREKKEYEKEINEVEKIKGQIARLEKEIAEIENSETIQEEEKIEKTVEETYDLIEGENEEIIENKFLELKQENPKQEKETKNKSNLLIKTGKALYKGLKRKAIKYIILPATVATTLALSYHSPQEYYSMFENYKERHLDKYKTDDPNIVGIDALYNDTTSAERTTYDFIGKDKIDYKGGYYVTSVFDLSDKTPPRFKLINDRENFSKIDSAAGITTNLFKKFHKFSDFSPELKGHTGKNGEAKGDVPVVGYNTKTQIMRAGHYSEFNDDWLVSETYEIPLNFKLNKDSTINLQYHNQAMRMVPLTTNEKGNQIPFPIGITYDQKITKIKPNECTHFGTLEGGKVIMVCGNKQLQVNGSFADMFKVYERLQKEYKNTKVEAYLLDNGSYNLPIWDKDSVITPEEINNHLLRNYDGGTALVLVSDGRISPYEYKNKYKEYEHYTPNYTLDSITKKPARNEKSVIVLHHTGEYDNSDQIIKQFEDTTSETSAHVLILKDGTRHLFNTDDYVLAHAGKSDFNNKNKVNYFSIGIEMEGDTKNGHQFTVAQVESLLEYIRPRIEKYHIPFENITTHKIIRENYIKKHPNDKKVLPKEDLNDAVWKQLQELIQEKFYKDKKTKLTTSANKMLSTLTYQEAYRITKNRHFSIQQAEAILLQFNVPKENINKVIDWIKNDKQL